VHTRPMELIAGSDTHLSQIHQAYKTSRNARDPGDAAVQPSFGG
jgi:hypothetical protein